MQPQYSVLFCNQDLGSNYDNIKIWLNQGIKVFWFGKTNEVQKLKADFSPFVSALFLQCYVVNMSERAIIVDGQNSESVINILEKQRPEFNAAQYLVEHCKADQHIIVEASAGTGKTTVMIDRILYLLHTIEDLKPADIYMITFTNDATNQMNERLQKMLLKKYQLTGNIRYLKWLEEQSQMNISTIHSFAYMLLKEYGADNNAASEFLKEEYEEYLLKTKIMANSYTPYYGVVVCVSSDDDVVDKPTLAKVANSVLDVKEVKACFVIGRVSNESVGISARSDGTINVQKIMESLNGGGHYSAAATELENSSVEHAKEMLESKMEGFIGDTRISD